MATMARKLDFSPAAEFAYTADHSGLELNISVPAELKPAGTSGPKLLQIERAKASFSSDELAVYLYGTAYLERVRKLLRIIEPEEAFDKRRHNYLGRSERFRHALRKEKRFAQLAQEHKWDSADALMADMLIDTPGPLSVVRLRVERDRADGGISAGCTSRCSPRR